MPRGPEAGRDLQARLCAQERDGAEGLRNVPVPCNGSGGERMFVRFDCGQELYIDNVHPGSILDEKHPAKIYCPACCKKEHYVRITALGVLCSTT